MLHLEQAEGVPVPIADSLVHGFSCNSVAWNHIRMAEQQDEVPNLETCSLCGGWGHSAAECCTIAGGAGPYEPISPKLSSQVASSQRRPSWNIDTNLEEAEAWQTTLKIEIRTLDGTDFLLEFDRGCSVLDLKTEIAEIREIPQQCIVLVRDADILNDTGILGENGEDALSISLVVSAEPIYQQLKQEQPLERRELLRAIEDLSRITEQGDERAISAVGVHLEHQLPDIRKTALETLSKIAEKSVDVAVPRAKILDRLDDSHWKVRRSAVRALSKFVEQGDERAVAALITRCDDQEREVRGAAVQALVEIAKQGDKQVVAAFTRLKTDTHKEVRQAAEKALIKISEQGDEHIISSSSSQGVVVQNRLLAQI